MTPDPLHLGLPWALAEAQAFHLRGVGRHARAERAAARRRAEQDAPLYLAAETARLTCASLAYAVLETNCVTGATWTFRPPADPGIRAMVVAELYRHAVDGRPVRKLRVLGQGWADGLDGPARAYGVDVE
ncbi:hypothetical protein [Streptomyces sp. JNUCC 63]